MSEKKFVSGFGVKLLVVAACFAASFSVKGQQAAEPTAADQTATPVAVSAPVAAAAVSGRERTWNGPLARDISPRRRSPVPGLCLGTL